MSHPDFPDYFSADSAGYRTFRPTYPPALFTWLAGIAPGHGLAWDAGTGNGQCAVALATHFDRVVATDASAEQIREAETHPRVTYRVALAEEGCPDEGSADLVTVAQALHWFDPPRFFEAARRALRPGGVIAVWCYSGVRVSPEVDDVIARFNRDHVGRYWPPERVLVDDGYAAIPFPFETLGGPHPPMDLSVAWDAPMFLGYLGTWSATRRCRAATGSDPIEAVAGPLLAAWGPGTRMVRWPLHVRVGRV